MRCGSCGGAMLEGLTTDVTDLGDMVIIIRNVPCFKCTECNDIFYTTTVLKRLEEIIEEAKRYIQEIAVIDFSKVA